MSRKRGGLITAVRPGSIGDEVGLEPGDRLISINGHVLRDVIDYRFYGAEEELVLVVEREGERHRLEIERDYDEDLGLEFSEPTFDGMRRCDNRCPFCFVQQMPRGMRRTLYVRDDDYRYSFLLGNFSTLTNLTERDWQRISEQHLSPLYVSIHATDVEARRRVLGNPQAPDIMAQLQRLAELGIQVHGQIVITPGLNDGAVLRRSIADLAGLWPTVQTLALVPVGLTRYHRGGLRMLSPAEARDVLQIAEAQTASARRQFKRTWLYPSDELFLLAGWPIPESAFYDDDAQRENGVGLVRALLDDWAEVRGGVRLASGEMVRMTLVCGTLIAATLRDMATDLQARADIKVWVIPVVNQLFGESVTVSGLLSGQDVLEALRGRELGQCVVLPRAMFDASGRLTLDDLTLASLEERIGVQVLVADRLSQVVATLSAGRGTSAGIH